MKHPNPNMLLRIAQGDAYCLATEYIKFPRDKKVYDEALKFERYVRHPTYQMNKNTYSDDTQMSIAVSEVLLKGEHFSKEAYADAFVSCFKRDWRNGYSRGFQHFLESINSGEEFIAKIKSDSDKNGAAMRSVPIGVLKSIDDVFTAAEIQAKLTHDTTDGVLSSQVVALASHFALHEEKELESIEDYIDEHLPEFFKTISAIKFKSSDRVKGPRVGIKTVIAVIDLIVEEKNLLDILKAVIERGGDTDSVAAIAFGIASTRMDGCELPSFLEYALEPGGNYGVTFLRKLGRDLMDKFNPSSGLL